MSHVIIIGAGLGGLATSIRLARQGHRVEIWEKNATPGGKLQEVRAAGFRWDTGPSLLTMPHVLHNLFACAQRKLEDYLTLERLPVTCRYFWEDGRVIDEDAAFWARPEVSRFLTYARGIYDLSGEAYLHHPPSEFWRAISLGSLPKLRHLPKVATFQTLAKKVEAYFSDPHLRQLFYRFATYNGSDPFRTPATFNIIPYVEHHFGGWYPRGGLARLPEALARLATELGVRLVPNVTATHYDGRVLTGSDGCRETPDAVICNQDVLAAAQTWLRPAYSAAELKKLLTPPLSCSGFVMFLGVKRRHPALSHHNIFFSRDYPREFAEIFTQRRLATSPTIYVAITARADADHAPPDMDNYFVLVNAPALSSGKLPAREVTAYGDLILARLEQCGLARLREEVVYRQEFTSEDFSARDLSHHGSLYGWASHSIKSALFRPPLRHPRWKNLHFVGGTTHPGGGIPLVLLSAEMVARRFA